MPDFLCLRCYACGTFQSVQRTVRPKWACKVCTEKQSVLRSYCGSTVASDVRRAVQALNLARGRSDAALAAAVLDGDGGGDSIHFGGGGGGGGSWDGSAAVPSCEEREDEPAHHGGSYFGGENFGGDHFGVGGSFGGGGGSYSGCNAEHTACVHGSAEEFHLGEGGGGWPSYGGGGGHSGGRGYGGEFGGGGFSGGAGSGDGGGSCGRSCGGEEEGFVTSLQDEVVEEEWC
ncbi:hypothetical protein EMIHUDRAFT_120548 [Emiliania huxleyi CCMP1516]|uniref:MRN complex-interacting protein N-terminal domain-containing protein n=2 Tax=Emiliania huxleyi TaxID=2903 RepID=A0A0D3IH02_EMIH1|nr:hypothetical protein EMIHUDRAFT_120548 [Emiliania huxleyi CCMP1516]EOD10537.1 hypothetical protein EMIHUDRAFT_120548 [Emiliania huxleyi CCMP1516]|eukprot:XP_005762966.1 hypothetical protein EMIHUDRAFT_120548 [Emiliania huxleyi CCMP1516]